MFGRKTLILLVALLGLLPCWSNIAAAGAAGRTRSEFVISGVIGTGTYQRFIAAIERQHPDVVVLEGPGGLVFEATLIGTEIRRRGISTRVRDNRSCASACAIIFLSGRSKYLGQGSSIGVHAAANGSTRSDATGTKFMTEYLRRVGAPRDLLRKIASVPPSEIHWLTKSEQRALRIRASG